MRLPVRTAPFLFAVIQAGLTTGIATGLATYQAFAFSERFWTHWLASWAIAWLLMVPLVIAAAPLIQRAVAALTNGDGNPAKERRAEARHS